MVLLFWPEANLLLIINNLTLSWDENKLTACCLTKVRRCIIVVCAWLIFVIQLERYSVIEMK
jgi:hypothetical protein